MKLKNVLLTGLLMTALSVSTVFAGEAETELPAQQGETAGGLLSSIFGGGGLLEQSGLLSDGGALDSLLAEDGPINGLLAKDGPVANLVAEDGPIAGLLAEDGPIAGLLADDSKIAGLFAEGGPLAGVLPEGTDVNALLGSAREKLGEADGELTEALNSLSEKIEDGSLNLDADSLKEYAENLVGSMTGGLSGGLLGGEDFDFSELEAYMETAERISEEEEAYYKEYNADYLESGDVQIVTDATIHLDDFDQEEFRSLRNLIQSNFTVDEENVLRPVGSTSDVILFVHQKNEDGTCPITDASFAEDGEGYAASIEAMCEEVGEPVEDCFEMIEFNKAWVLEDMKEYLEEHPDLAGAEYGGEVMTAQELDDLWGQMMSEQYAEAPETETEEPALPETETE